MYTEDDIQTIVNGYLKDIKHRFAGLLSNETDLVYDEREIVKQMLGYACNHSKDDMTIADAYAKGLSL